MTQVEALVAVFQLQRAEDATEPWVGSGDVDDHLEHEDIGDTSRTLLRAYRNGRLARRWVVTGGRGGGHYAYTLTSKGREYLYYCLQDDAA